MYLDQSGDNLDYLNLRGTEGDDLANVDDDIGESWKTDLTDQFENMELEPETGFGDLENSDDREHIGERLIDEKIA